MSGRDTANRLICWGRQALVLALGLTSFSALLGAEIASGRQPLLRASGAGYPWINLRDSRLVETDFRGKAAFDYLLASGAVEPLSMVSGDFDEDGMPDLVCGFAGSDGGSLVFYRGNVDALFPTSPEARERKLAGTFTEAPFLGPARVTGAPTLPLHLGAGDFDADGHQDLVLAHEAGTELRLLSGDGEGGFQETAIVKLNGEINGLVTGEINRSDGLPDLVVGISSPEGNRVLVFEGPRGALRHAPEILEVPSPARSLALGQLDGHYAMDLAVGCQGEVMIFPGRDRQLYLPDSLRPEIPKPQPLSVAVAGEILGLAIGDFTGDFRKELAILDDSGQAKLLSLGPDEPPALMSWTSMDIPGTAYATQSVSSPRAKPFLFAAKMASIPNQQLVVFQPARSLSIAMDPDAFRSASERFPGLSGTSTATFGTSEAVGVLPMRLSADAFDDLVFLAGGAIPGVSVAATTPNITYRVNQPGTQSDASSTDGKCDTDLAQAGNQCTCNAAAQEANKSPGLDAIEFDISETDSSSSNIPIMEPVVIDGTSQGRVYFGQSIRLGTGTGGSTIRGLAFKESCKPSIDSSGNVVENNYIGVDPAGALAHEYGLAAVTIRGSNNLIGGATTQARNLISGDGGYGVLISGQAAVENRVYGNLIGTDISGEKAIGENGEGIEISGLASNNEIGGSSAGARNVIVGARLRGIDVSTAGQGNKVQGNHIGVSLGGTVGLGNGEGIQIHATAGTTIGGSSVSSRNTVSGNTGRGVGVSTGCTDTLIQGNFIGTDSSGSVAIGNGSYGVGVASPTTIGGSETASGNLISGNGAYGIFGLRMTILNNLVGTSAAGTGAIPNKAGISCASDCTVGAEGAGNVISGNGFDCQYVSHCTALFATNNNRIQANLIGVQIDAVTPLGNLGDGLVLLSNNTMGGADPGVGNTIAYNVGRGIYIASGDRNSILGNRIYNNGGLGIDLGSVGPLKNDVLDGDGGDNRGQNYPVIGSYSGTTVKGTLNSLPNTTFTIELFTNSVCDPSGWGEGENPATSFHVTTDAAGNAAFTAPLPEAGSRFATATATDPDGNTSEFCACAQLREDHVVINSISPPPAAGFPVVTEQTVTFTNVSVTYDLTTEGDATVYLRAYANNNIDLVLAETNQRITRTDSGSSSLAGTLNFPVLLATGVTQDINSISVVALLVPDVLSDYSAISEPWVYARQDSIAFKALSPDPENRLVGNEKVTISADLEYRMTSQPQGRVELQIRHQEGQLLLDTPFKLVNAGFGTVTLEGEITVPNDANTLTVDGVLFPTGGTSISTRPSIEYLIERVRIDSIDPPTGLSLTKGEEQTFDLRISFHLVSKSSGKIRVDVKDQAGTVIPPIEELSNYEIDVARGSDVVQLITRVMLPATVTRIEVIASLLDGQTRLAEDKKNFSVSRKGRVVILGSNPEIPLELVRVTAENSQGQTYSDLSNADGLYELPLSAGVYTFNAEPRVDAVGVRVPAGFAKAIAADDPDLPKIEMGVANRKSSLIETIEPLSTYGLFSGPLFPGFLSNVPYADEVDAMVAFAQGYPAWPTPTDERLFRLWLAATALKTVAQDSQLINDALKVLLIDLAADLVSLDKINDKVAKGVKKKGLTSIKTRIRGSDVDGSQLQGLTDAATRSAGAQTSGVQDFLHGTLLKKKSIDGEFLRTWLSLAIVDGHPTDFIKFVTEQLPLDEALDVVFARSTEALVQSTIQTAATFSPRSDTLPEETIGIEGAIRLSNKLTQQKLEAVEKFVSAALEWTGWVNGHAGRVGASLEAAAKLEQSETSALVGATGAALGAAGKLLGLVERFLKLSRIVDVSAHQYALYLNLEQILAATFQVPRSAAAGPARFGTGASIAAFSVHGSIRHQASSTADALVQALDIAANLIREDRFGELVDHLATQLYPKADQNALMLQLMFAPMQNALADIYRDEYLSDRYAAIVESGASLQLRMAGLSLSLTAFVFDAGFLAESDFVARRDEILASITDIRQAVLDQSSVTQEFASTMGERGLLPPTVAVGSIDFLSGSTPLSSISVMPTEIRVRASISNPGAQVVTGIRSSLVIPGSSIDVTVAPAGGHQIGSLGGGETKTLEWTVTFRGPAALEGLGFRIEVEPVAGDAFLPDFGLAYLPVILEQDSDGDLLSDPYESALGLDPSKADSTEDRDNDGLSNLTEALTGTDPGKPDTDGDGFTDSDEVEEGSDPLDTSSVPDQDRVPGDFNGDETLDIVDLVSLILYLQGEGVAPYPESRADVNEDGKVDVADIVSLTNEIRSEAVVP